MDKLSKKQEEILIGSMLGDGSLFKNKEAKYPYLCITRKRADKPYLQYEFNYFKQFCSYNELKDEDIFDKRTNKIYLRSKFATLPNEIFLPYYKKWYNKKKIVPKNLVLTPLICAIWFCDDGCIFVDKRSNRLKLKLATHGFTLKENQFLVKLLSDITKEFFFICKDNGNYFIGGADNATKAFIKYIESCIPKEMNRKITWNEGHLLQKGTFTQYKNRQENFLTFKEKEILKEIAKKKINQKEIADILNWPKSTVASCLKRMLKFKFIEKYIPNNLKIAKYYILTKKGQEVYNEIVPFDS